MVETPRWHTDNVPCAFAPLAMSDQGKESVVGGCWDAVNHGAQYRVELARDADFRQPLGPAEMTHAPSWSRQLGAGQYFVRVRSVDADGLSSQPSTARKIAVVPLILPPGSLADATHGAIVLPEGRELGEVEPLRVKRRDGVARARVGEHARDLGHCPVRHVAENIPVPVNHAALPVRARKHLRSGFYKPSAGV